MFSKLHEPFDFEHLFAPFPGLLSLQKRLERATREQRGFVICSDAPVMVDWRTGTPMSRFSYVELAHYSLVDERSDYILWYEIRRIAFGIRYHWYSDDSLIKFDMLSVPLVKQLNKDMNAIDRDIAKQLRKCKRLC